jgi:hypothetical protein
MSNIQPTAQGELQFRRWSDSSTQGVQVTFGLPDREALEPLIGKEGKRFAFVLVEIADDETPVQPAPRKDTRGPLCREACDLCKMPEFQAWAHERADYDGEPDEHSAKTFILGVCGVESRKDLDLDELSYSRFARFVRNPFLKYRREQA